MESGKGIGGSGQSHPSSQVPDQPHGKGRKKGKKGRVKKTAVEKPALSKSDKMSQESNKSSSDISERTVSESTSKGWLESLRLGGFWRSAQPDTPDSEQELKADFATSPAASVETKETQQSVQMQAQLDQMQKQRDEQNQQIAELQKLLKGEQKKNAKLVRQHEQDEKQKQGYERDLRASGHLLDSVQSDVVGLKKEVVKRRTSQLDERVVATNNLHRVLGKLEQKRGEVKTLSGRLAAVSQRASQLSALFQNSRAINGSQKDE